MAITNDCCCGEGQTCPDTADRIIFSESMSTDDVSFDIADVFTIIQDGNYNESPTISAPAISMTYPGGEQQLEIDVPANSEEFSNVIQYTFVPFFFSQTHTLDEISVAHCCGRGYSVCVEAKVESLSGVEESLSILAIHKPSGGVNAGKMILGGVALGPYFNGILINVLQATTGYMSGTSFVDACSRRYIEGPNRVETVDEGEETEIPYDLMSEACEDDTPSHCTYSEDGENEVGFVVMLAAKAGYGANVVVKMRSASVYQSYKDYREWNERNCFEENGDPCHKDVVISMSGFDLAYTPPQGGGNCARCNVQEGAAEAINEYLGELDTILGAGYVFPDILPYNRYVGPVGAAEVFDRLLDVDDYLVQNYRTIFTIRTVTVYDEVSGEYSVTLKVNVTINMSGGGGINVPSGCSFACGYCIVCGSWTYLFSPISQSDWCSGAEFVSDSYVVEEVVDPHNLSFYSVPTVPVIIPPSSLTISYG